LLSVYRAIQQFVDYLEMFSKYKQEENLFSMGNIMETIPDTDAVERAMLGP
jgi:DNA-directed RNA polymerase II subunit RPB4